MEDNRQPINLIGGGFHHVPSTSGFEPKYMRWVKGQQTAPISVYVDRALRNIPNPNTKNYGWLIESKTIIGDIYSWCANNIKYLETHYIKVFTHDVDLIGLSDVFELSISSCKSFLSYGEVYPKSKLVSMVASSKTMCAEHQYRQEIVRKFSGQCDLYGRGYNPVHDKTDALKDYCFSITMENGTYPNMVSEKITDCFMTGTIPIYYGIKNIGDFFNADGIIMLTDDFKIEDLTFELYQSKIEAVKENFEITKNLLCSEDYMYINFIEPNLNKNE